IKWTSRYISKHGSDRKGLCWLRARCCAHHNPGGEYCRVFQESAKLLRRTMPQNLWTGSDFSKNRAGGRSNERAPERRYFRRIFRRITGWFLRLFRGNLAGAFMVIDVVRQRSVTYSINMRKTSHLGV